MNPQERTRILYGALVFSSNALSILKFSATTLEFNNKLTTFDDLAINAYYAMYVNLAALFGNRKDAPNLMDCIKSNKSGNEIHKTEDLEKLEAIIAKHKKTIEKVMDIRNKAVAHISNDLMAADLSQDSMDVQILIKDLIDFFGELKSITVDRSRQEIHDYAPKIRDDLGQRELWNSKHGEMLKEILSSK